MGFNGDYRGLINQKQGCWWIYPLVNCHITTENHHFKFGKSTISTGPFSIAMLNDQNV